MKFLLLSVISVIPCLGQFQLIEIAFDGVGCASCIESMSARIGRMRGVDSAMVDAQRGVVKVQLAAQNRVRLEQIRDFIEQDGTKATRATVRVKGEISERDGKWLLQPSGLPASYEVAPGELAALQAGSCLLTGEVAKLRPDSGAIVIKATHAERHAR